MSKKVLVVSGHPDLKKDSLANKTILKEVKKLYPEVELDILSNLYPDYQIDVAAEQDKLRWADVIVFQYPLYWYMTPSLMNKWIEKVFVHGFSHGSNGDALKGKVLIASLTTGAGEVAYSAEAGTTIEDLLAPIRLTAKLTQLNFVGHIVTHGVSYSLREDADKAQELVEKSQEHSQKLVEMIKSL
ncbi:flavodoxin family protein [Streptococcus vicugnae]|uniref:Flavodoxin family protein n=1 Tax=Streptococcus vicugnae TaxID=2740579 RepID=A0A4R5G6A5_9STRE|nr:NAD(P)H-dependent oxidoreductase [Streptococcus vicugnae]TDE75305.1 flavodoxin family protein [Streptococcus vicugnae]